MFKVLSVGLLVLFSALSVFNYRPVDKLVEVKKPQLLSYVEHGNQNRPEISLTFDADMTPYMLSELKSGKVKSWYNHKIIEILKQKNIPATIFLTGMWAQTYPEVTNSLAKDPLFEIANHSYSHPAFTSDCFGLPPVKDKENEFVSSQKILLSISGYAPTLFRFPGGCRSEADIKLANKHGLTVVQWDDASGDSFNGNHQKIINTLKSNTKNGSILVFHLNGNKNAPLTADVLPEIIDHLLSKGYRFVKVSELIANL